MEKEQREHRALLRPVEFKRPTVMLDLEWAKDAELQAVSFRSAA